MDDPKSHFRAVLIDILDRLSVNDRKKLTFLLGDGIERGLRDDPTIGGTLNVFQQLLDRGKISDENFKFLIDAFQRIKCHQAAKSLKEFQKKLLKTRLSYHSTTHSSHCAQMHIFPSTGNGSQTQVTATVTNNSSSQLVTEMLRDPEEDESPSRPYSYTTKRTHTGDISPDLPQTGVTSSTQLLETSNGDVGSFSVGTEIREPVRKYCLSERRLIWLSIVTMGLVLTVLIVGIIIFVSVSPPITTTTVSVMSSKPQTIPLSTTSVVINDTRCELPREASCTSITPPGTKAEGLGVYYESPCNGVGCGFLQPYCRLCWISPTAVARMDRPECPPCVATVLNKRSWY